jgi:HEAT repeat protein
MSNLKKQIAAVAFTTVLALGTVAQAGRGGSASRIRNAVQTRSVDAIIAEVERAEHLVCQDCADVMTTLLDHDRYEIREVAAWWFAKRPSVNRVMIEQMVGDLGNGDAIVVRNAADYLGTVRAYGTLPQLLTAFQASDNAEARLHIVRAAGRMGALSGADILEAGFGDGDATIRAESARWYRDLRGQTDAAPLAPLLGDGDANVRAQAATAIGGLKGAGSRATLEGLVANDPDAAVRRNACWALGQIGDSASADVLRAAENDPSGLVRRAAKAARANLR